jgi:pimeloyl-ACP methyl ester carboxylesterase
MPASILRAIEKKEAKASDLETMRYRTVEVDGVDIFYREAGDPCNPSILLLHGFPTSSQMFRNLMPLLADKYHLVAPDYPGFGQSSMPDRANFAYTFENFSHIVEDFAEAIGLTRYALYVMDYGAPIGYRIAARNPTRITALVIQNGNAYEEGLRDFWIPIKRYWADNSAANRDAIRPLLTLEITKFQYAHGESDASLLSPDAWTADQYLLDRPGNNEIQLDIFYDYRTNVPLYPTWQAYFRTHQPPALIVWGKNDPIFPSEGAEPYKGDLEKLEYHLLDAGHFALESKVGKIAGLMRKFLHRHRKTRSRLK